MKTSSKIKIILIATAILLLPTVLASCCCTCLTTTGAVLGTIMNSSSTPDFPADPDGSEKPFESESFGPGYDDGKYPGYGEYPEDGEIYKITFISNGGDELGTLALKSGDSLPDTYRSDVTFGGWYSDPNLTEPVYTVPSEDITLYAHWLEETKAGEFEYYDYSDNLVDIYRYYGNDDYVHIPEYIDGKRVIGISDMAFAYNDNLREVIISDNVETIGTSAFYSCTSLENVCLGMNTQTIGETAFANCSSLRSIDIGVNVSVIGESAFVYCTSLEEVNFNTKSLTEVGQSAFDSCTSLKRITLPNSLTSISNGMFAGCTSLREVKLGDGTQMIGDEAFAECDSLEHISIPSSVSSIGFGAFSNCDALMKINLVDGLESIGEKAFQNCPNLGNVSIPSSVVSIGNEAFTGCTSITEISIPNNVTILGEGIFAGCTAIKTVYLDIAGIPADAFYNCSALESVYFSENITQIGAGAFGYCSSLKSIAVPNTVESIGSAAFGGCTSLEEITLPFIGYSRDYSDPDTAHLAYIFGSYSYGNYVPSSLRKVTITEGNVIPKRAFCDCEYISEFIFEEDITTIEEQAFYGCRSMTEFTFSDNIRYIGSYAFEGCSLTELYFPVDYEALDAGADYEIFFAESALYGCGEIVSATIPTGAIPSLPKEYLVDLTVNFGSVIPECSFEGRNALQTVYIGTTVATIEDRAFANCINLKTVSTGSPSAYGMGVTSIGGGAFVKCTALETVSLGSAADIGEFAFANCENLTSITIPNSTFPIFTTINDYAFECCTRLMSVNLGTSINYIGDWAFYDCYNLQEVCYAGTEADWNEVTIGENNDDFINATIYYNADIY